MIIINKRNIPNLSFTYNNNCDNEPTPFKTVINSDNTNNNNNNITIYTRTPKTIQWSIYTTIITSKSSTH